MPPMLNNCKCSGGLTALHPDARARVERAGGTPSHSPVKSAVYLSRAGLALLLALVRRRPAVDSSDSA